MRHQAKSGRGMRGCVFAVTAQLFGLFVLFILIAVCPINAYAHPPKEVTLSYTMSSQKLDVTIVHNSFFPNSHYIKEIEIKKNGVSVGVHNYQSQPTKSEFAYTYDVPASKGDIIEVTANCSLYGSKTVQLTVDNQASR